MESWNSVREWEPRVRRFDWHRFVKVESQTYSRTGATNGGFLALKERRRHSPLNILIPGSMPSDLFFLRWKKDELAVRQLAKWVITPRGALPHPVQLVVSPQGDFLNQFWVLLWEYSRRTPIAVHLEVERLWRYQGRYMREAPDKWPSPLRMWISVGGNYVECYKLLAGTRVQHYPR